VAVCVTAESPLGLDGFLGLRRNWRYAVDSAATGAEQEEVAATSEQKISVPARTSSSATFSISSRLAFEAFSFCVAYQEHLNP
jgi:hypothetical protein